MPRGLSVNRNSAASSPKRTRTTSYAVERARRTVLKVARVGSDYVDEAAVQQAEGGGASRAAEAANNGASPDLGEAAQLHPGFQPVEVFQGGVALWMSRDGNDAGIE